MIADGAGRAVAFALAPGQAHELPHAVPLLARLPDVPLWVVADRSLSGHALREHVWGSRHASNRRAARHPSEGERGAGRLPAVDLRQPHPRRAVRGTASDGPG